MDSFFYKETSLENLYISKSKKTRKYKKRTFPEIYFSENTDSFFYKETSLENLYISKSMKVQKTYFSGTRFYKNPKF